MKGDFSRLTFDRRKRYSGVLMQQGRVQTDADWNEQLEIQHRRTETEARDVIGLCGVPKETGGFEVQTLDSPAPLTPFDLSVSDGRIYVDGLLCETEASKVALSSVQGIQATAATLDVDGRPLRPGQWVTVSGDDGANSTRLIVYVDEGLGVLTFDANLPSYQDSDHPFLRRVTTYLTQPDLASPQFAEPPDPDAPVQPPSLKLPEGHYLAYLHVFERHVTALNDPLIREKALGGPDTTTRIRNVWQLGLLPVATPNNQDVDCESQLPEWDALVAPPTGLMNARTQPEDDPKDPCLLPPEAGYRRLENQLYRVEVHKGGPRASASFKWSRENGSIQTKVEKINGTAVIVSDLGRDEVLGFSGGQWVEIVDDESELTGTPRPLALVTKVTKETREITLDTDISALDGLAGLRLRRWDQPGDEGTADGLPMAAGWLDIEGGIQVEFSEGTYRAGDYWLIPARTATADIEWPPYGVPDESPQAQPPRGVKHHYCRLALLFSNDDGVAVVEDCRKLFPPLTHICAEDVCFDNTTCDLPNAETVQDAIEQLCHGRDLRFHNKHLHGWGIVCGLQVNCGPDERGGRRRRHVTVRKGYAIDCEGNDIIHEADEPLDLIGMIEEYDEQHPDAPLLSGDGEVCLVLTGDDDKRYALERYDPASEGFNSIFKNTLWADFFEDCLGQLVGAVRKEFSDPPGQTKGLVSAAQKRWTTLLNLLIQLFNKTNGRYVYLSGEKGLEDLRTEHTILKNLYESLRGLIQSHTFCGQFDDTQFPEYPYANLNDPSKDPPYIPTVFGKGFHRRLRVHPNGRRAYTCGLGNKINVYNLVSNEMVEELKFPDDGAQVRDVAFSREGGELYAVATLNGKDSFFAVAGIGGTGHEWKSSSIVCDVQLVTLATRKGSDIVYAAGKGKGIYEINVKNVQPNLQPAYPFNAVGHLVVVEKGREAYAYATARTHQTPPGRYDQVQRYDLVIAEKQPEFFALQVNESSLTGSDDIAVAYDAKPTPLLFVVADPPSFSDNKQLVVFDARGPQFGTPTLPWLVDLEENAAVRLAYNYETRNLMLTFADSYRVRLVREDTNEIATTYQLDQNFRYPVQVSPTAIAVGPDPRGEGTGRVYVLNSISNTINHAPASRFTPARQIPLQPLVDYRAAVLEAFVRLFGGLLQYLKDCLCDHLLVNCPECDRDDKIYLACVQIREGSVYKICNFSKRKYVKSFPTVEYWLSAVPVLPLIGKAVEKLCCAVLPEWFGRYTASKTVQSPNVVTSAMLQIAAGALKGGGAQALFGKQFGGLGDAFVKLLRDWLLCASREDEDAGGIAREDLIGRRMQDVKGLVRDSVNVVGVEEYDPCDGLQNLLRLFTTPSRLAEGSDVRLFVEEGTIRNYSTVAGATGRSVPTESDEAVNVEPAQTFAAALRQTETPEGASAPGASGEEVRSLREELAAMREEFGRARAEYERNLEELKQQVGALAQKRTPRKPKAE